MSVAEKYDILQNRFDYPTVTSERRRTSPSAADWEGICHGWAPASILYREPSPVTAVAPNGTQVPMGSSDVKALLSYYHAVVDTTPAAFLGARCDIDLGANPSAGTRPECRDTNAGAFHIVLTNQIGRWKKSFLMDVTRDLQVWNQPVHAYRLSTSAPQAPSFGAAPGTVKEVTVQAEVFYSVETEAVWQSHGAQTDSKIYKYRLELDSNNSIIGGEWITSERPDFLWQQNRPVFSGYYANIEKIYNQSVGEAVDPQPTPVPTAVPTTAPTAQPQPTAAPTVIPTAAPTPIVVPTTEPVEPQPRPTEVPLPPQPRPTAVPLPPQPLPTAMPLPPQPRPTAVPLPPQPRPTAVPVPDPVVTPVVIDSSDDLRYCPRGYRAMAAISDLGAQGVWICIDAAQGNKVLGPFPSQMVDACLAKTNNSKGCRESSWSSQTYFTLRGEDSCPAGAQATSSNVCVDERGLAYGPFSVSLVQKCRLAHGNACENIVWSESVVRKLQGF